MYVLTNLIEKQLIESMVKDRENIKRIMNAENIPVNESLDLDNFYNDNDE